MKLVMANFFCRAAKSKVEKNIKSSAVYLYFSSCESLIKTNWQHDFLFSFTLFIATNQKYQLQAIYFTHLTFCLTKNQSCKKVQQIKILIDFQFLVFGLCTLTLLKSKSNGVLLFKKYKEPQRYIINK